MSWPTTVKGLCARPACRSWFDITLGGRGRPQQYCTEECRRTAQKERRHVESVVAHFDRALQMAKRDLARFDPDEAESPEQEDGCDPE